MNPVQLKVWRFGLSFLFIFVSGFWLHHSGKPYSGIVLAAHKLISLAAIVFLVMLLTQANRAARLDGTAWIVVGIAAFLSLLTMITGGLLSADKPMPAVISLTHRITPYLTAFSVAAILYLLLKRK